MHTMPSMQKKKKKKEGAVGMLLTLLWFSHPPSLPSTK